MHRYLIHQGTGESEKRQKSVFSENENVGSVWTVSPNAQDLCVFTKKIVVVWTGPLS